METPKDIKLKPTTKIININDKIDYFQSWLNFKQRVNGRENREIQAKEKSICNDRCKRHLGKD